MDNPDILWKYIENLLSMVKIPRWQIEILLRMVGIFMITGWDFHDDRSRFQWLQVEIFMMADRGFHNDKSRFSW